MPTYNETFSEGQRISVRGEDFMITGVKPSDNGRHLLYTKGISELVKDRQFIFDTAVDKDIVLVDPKKMHFIPDNYNGYILSKLYIENAMRCNPLTADKLSICTKAAFNEADYQLTPTWKAMQLPRPRFLIADGVGLGKTIEVGIFLSEMIKRSKGTRILIVALKSILAQFQEEMWNRFAIPFVRLDSYGVDKIKTRIPANKNPFDYYDKTIISIDTLKNDSKFRHYLEKTRWDIVVIDECHIVANADSQRGELANLLAQRCESLILTSATPHNGRQENFANLIRMIEPTAIPRTGTYDKENVKDYYVRRFKNDIQDEQVRKNFQDRQIVPDYVKLNPLEEEYMSIQQDYKAHKKNEQGADSPDVLYSIGLFKSFLSSPEAAMETLEKRLDSIRKSGNTPDSEVERMRDILNEIITTGQNSKYLRLVEILKRLKWAGRSSDERYVIFSERIATIQMLRDRIMKDFRIKNEKSICAFTGNMSDVEQEAMIEDFSKEDSEIRLLICSDAGSQGVNLHYFCNRMFNYDIPWSLITLEQRNGRVDRYGQKKTPYIHYLIEESDSKKLKTDLRILEVLMDKEIEVNKTLGDTGAITELLTPEKEERLITEAIANDEDDLLGGFDIFGNPSEGNPVIEKTAAVEETSMTEDTISLFGDDFSFYAEMMNLLESKHYVTHDDYTIERSNNFMTLRNNKALDSVLFDVPDEAKPELNGDFKLTTDKNKVMESIDRSRKKDSGSHVKWAEFQILYDLHPAIHHYQSCLDSCLDKDQALAARMSRLPEGTAWYVFHGSVSNGLGQQIISEFFVVPMYSDGRFGGTPIPMKKFAEKYLKGTIATSAMSGEDMVKLEELLGPAVDCAVDNYMSKAQAEKAAEMLTRKEDNLKKIEEWKINAEHGQLSLFSEGTKAYDRNRREIETIHSESSRYINDMNTLKGDPFVRPLAVFYNFQ